MAENHTINFNFVDSTTQDSLNKLGNSIEKAKISAPIVNLIAPPSVTGESTISRIAQNISVGLGTGGRILGSMTRMQNKSLVESITKSQAFKIHLKNNTAKTFTANVKDKIHLPFHTRGEFRLRKTQKEISIDKSNVPFIKPKTEIELPPTISMGLPPKGFEFNAPGKMPKFVKQKNVQMVKQKNVKYESAKKYKMADPEIEKFKMHMRNSPVEIQIEGKTYYKKLDPKLVNELEILKIDKGPQINLNQKIQMQQNTGTY